MSARNSVGFQLTRAEEALGRGAYPEALAQLTTVLATEALDEGLLERTLDAFLRAATATGAFGAALAAASLRADATSERDLVERVSPRLRARTTLAWAERAARMGAPDAPRHFLEAARTYLASGCSVRAAIAHERAGDTEGALALWKRLAERLESGRERDGANERYAAGLARFNAARMHRRTGAEAEERTETVASVHDLELAADLYEREGLRERAFDCYQVLITIGRQSGQLEHALEGYVNAIRVLRDDNLKPYALQHMDDALTFAETKGEFAAAASFAAELAAYATNLEMRELAAFARGREAELRERAANAVLARGGPPKVAENALLAALTAWADERQYRQVGRLFARLAELPIEAERRDHYLRAAARHGGVPDEPRTAAPLDASMRQPFEFPEVWHIDLVEHEDRNAPSSTLLDIVHESERWSEGARLRALAALVEAEVFEARVDANDDDAALRLVERLETVNLYPVLSLLEGLYGACSGRVRDATIRVLARFSYKRSFVTLSRALRDEDETVRRRARTTVSSLAFPHAVDPLVRLYREESEEATREALLRALARIDLPEAAEVVLGALRHGTEGERNAVLEATQPGRNRALSEQLHRVAGELTASERQRFGALLQPR
jgi:hypothetical protein